MTAGRRRWRVVGDALRTQLWPLPAAGIALAVGLGVGLPRADRRLVGLLPVELTGYLFSGGPDAARSVLAAVAGSLITVTSLTFSLTIVTLQLASSQYSPRLLRTFARDRTVHGTLTVLLATFTYTLTIMRTVRTAEDGRTGFVPQLSVTVAYLLALVSVITVVLFLAHLARQIRAESIMQAVHAAAAATIDQVLPAAPAVRPDPPTDRPVPVCAVTSGFLTSIDTARLLAAAVEADATVFVDRPPGEFLIAGTPVARIWPADRREADDQALVGVAAKLHTGFERTSTQDMAFGFRQLVDVAVKALSPGINDPTTAVHALGHASSLLCRVAGRDPGPDVLRDESGQVRVVLARPDAAALLDLVVSQPRRYGAAEPEVLGRLFTVLREVAWASRDSGLRAAIADQEARLRATVAAQPFDEAERAALAGLADLVGAALAGRWQKTGHAPNDRS